MTHIIETLTTWEIETLDTMGILDKIAHVENTKADLLDALKYAQVNLEILTKAAIPTARESVLSQDWYTGGIDILRKLDKAIREASE